MEDESKKTHYVSWFVFKVNKTQYITRVSLNKDPKKSQVVGTQTLKVEISEVNTIVVERIEDINRMPKELEKSQRKMNPE